MKAELITSGTELLLGEVADVNTYYIAGQLAALGIDLYYCSTVGDNFERFSAVLRQALGRLGGLEKAGVINSVGERRDAGAAKLLSSRGCSGQFSRLFQRIPAPFCYQPVPTSLWQVPVGPGEGERAAP